MTSTGNDIVALNQLQSSAFRPAFSDKILCRTELALFNGHACTRLSFEKFTRLLWSVKEAVYKFHRRNNPAFSFSPKKIIITALELPQQEKVVSFGYGYYERRGVDAAATLRCVAQADGKIFYSASVLYADCLHSIAAGEPGFENVWWGIKHINEIDYPHQSEEVRSFLLKKLADIFPKETFRIHKTPEYVPYLVKNQVALSWPLSFSHHDQFVAYSLVMQNHHTLPLRSTAPCTFD